MTTTPDYLPTHLVAVTYDAGPAGHGCRAECDCGWHSDSFGDDYAAADLAASEHRDEMANPLDDLDRLINRLLDLQDDLAHTVLWLIDNWEPGLPVPGCMALDGDRPALRLLGYCTDPVALERAAELLGTPVTEDTDLDRNGNPYRHTVGDFGLVRLDVFTDVDDEAA